VSHCGDYETELSALLDGESGPAEALELVEHVASCPSCGTFVRDLRAMQGIVDRAYTAKESQPAAAVGTLGMSVLRPRMRWAWGLAAAVVVTLGLSVAIRTASPGAYAAVSNDRELAVRLGEDGGAMTEERFVAMVTELLRAERPYRDHMYTILRAVREEGVADESGAVTEAVGSAEVSEHRGEPPDAAAALN